MIILQEYTGKFKKKKTFQTFDGSTSQKDSLLRCVLSELAKVVIRSSSLKVKLWQSWNLQISKHTYYLER